MGAGLGEKWSCGSFQNKIGNAKIAHKAGLELCPETAKKLYNQEGRRTKCIKKSTPNDTELGDETQSDNQTISYHLIKSYYLIKTDT